MKSQIPQCPQRDPQNPDARLLTFMGFAGGLCIWLAPWPWPLLPLLPTPTPTPRRHTPGFAPSQRHTLAFALFWSICLFIFHPHVPYGDMREAARAALDMAARLYMGLNLARCVTLHTSPLNLGRALTWHIRFIKPAWHCGLALTIMLAFIPRAAHCFINLRRSLTLRAPHLTPHKRIILLTLAALRLLGTQTWDMAACVAARNLYRPEPWLWHPSTPVDRKDTKR